MAVAATRLFLKYPVYDGDTQMDVVETVSAINALTGGAANTNIGTRMIVPTLARDNVAISIAADNIAGMHALPRVQ